MPIVKQKSNKITAKQNRLCPQKGERKYKDPAGEPFEPRQLFLFDLKPYSPQPKVPMPWPISLTRREMKLLYQIAWNAKCKTVSELLSKIAHSEVIVSEVK